MSCSTKIFLEYKKDGKWEWFTPLIHKNVITKYHTEKYDDNYNKMLCFDKQGIIRDILSDFFVSFNHNEFPSDMSNELKEYLSVDKLKYSYDRSYCSIKELNQYILNQITQIKNQIKDESRKTFEERLGNSVNGIIEYLKTSNLDCLIDISNNDEEIPYIDEYKFDLEAYESALEFISGLIFLIYNFTYFWSSDDNWRLVYYTS